MGVFLEPVQNQLLLLVAPHAGGQLMINLAARLACRGQVRILDGGNRFDLYHCTAQLAGISAGKTADLSAVLGRIQLRRAFTCFQVAALLREMPADAVPLLVLDMLSTFYDESAPAAECRRLLEVCLGQLRRLNRFAPVAISSRAQGGAVHLRAGLRSQEAARRAGLLERLQAAAGQVYLLEPNLSPSPQLSLWDENEAQGKR
jgi:hypothetical protein